MARAQPEDALLERMMQGGKLSKGSAVAIAKSRGWIKQAGAHLEPTAAGAGPIAKAKAHIGKPAPAVAAGKANRTKHTLRHMA